MGKQKECQHHLLSCYLVFNFTTYTSLPVFTRKSHQSRIGCFREGSHSSGGAGWSRGGRRPTVGWPCIILSRNTMGDVIGSSCLCVCAGLPERAAEPLATGLRQPHRGAEPVPKGGLVLWPEGQSPEDCHPGNVYLIGAHFNWCRLNKYHPWSVICAAVLQASVRQFGDPVLPQQICSHHWYPWHIWSVKIFFPQLNLNNVQVLWLGSLLFAGRLVYDRIWTMCSDPRPLPGKVEMLTINLKL